MKAIITVGLGFGDEGKGATVDYLTRRHNAELVVRYCGGAQAAHNVVLPDGTRHVFAQFGSGTLAGARTHLGSRVVVSPQNLEPEADHLETLGINDPKALLSIHPDCLITTSYHVMMNRLRELARGADKHGSCGLGIGEARKYWLEHGLDAVVASDLHDARRLRSKLVLLRDRFLLAMQELQHIEREFAMSLRDTSPDVEADLLSSVMEGVQLKSVLPRAKTIIFEGAQGVLLDEYFGFHPYTTWSTVTPKHALEIVDQECIRNVELLGITRAYTTRHGAGPFPTKCSELTAQLPDLRNPDNPWQDSLQCGPLDLILLRYAARAVESCGKKLDGIALNNVDQLSDSIPICQRYQGLDSLPLPVCMREQSQLTKSLERSEPSIVECQVDELVNELSTTIAPMKLIGRGPTYCDRSEVTGVSASTSARCYSVWT